MPYYIIYCKTAKERETVKSLKRIAARNDIPIKFRLQEKEMINHSRRGNITKVYVLIPGYIFAYSQEAIDGNLLALLTRANDFFRFLTYSDNSYVMRGRDEEFCAMLYDLPLKITKNNVLVRKGKVIIVKKGAFTTLKGEVVNIDPKRERVSVMIELLGKPTKIDLPVSFVEECEEEKEEKKELEVNS